MSNPNVPSHNSRPFFDVAREIRRGVFLDEAADAMQRVVAAVEETGKPAKLIIEIAVAPAAKGHGAVKIADRITEKLPLLPAGETIMFVTTDNNLVANDPRQASIEFKEVNSSRPAQFKTAT